MDDDVVRVPRFGATLKENIDSSPRAETQYSEYDMCACKIQISSNFSAHSMTQRSDSDRGVAVPENRATLTVRMTERGPLCAQYIFSQSESIPIARLRTSYCFPFRFPPLSLRNMFITNLILFRNVIAPTM